MGGESQPDKTAFNRQQFLRMIQSLDGFGKLIADIGSENTGAIADLLFASQVRDTNPDGKYILIAAGGQPDYPAMIDRLLLAECAQIREKRDYIAKLLDVMKDGKLRIAMAQMTEPEANYIKTRDRPRAGTPEREVASARDWVARSIHGDGRQNVHDALTRHVLTAPYGKALGPTAKLLDRIHAEVVPDSPRVRSPNSTTAYPSSVGGRFLLELIFKWTSAAIWPGPGDELWQDVALFYLGAVGSVQGYPDGNKRAARMAYAVTLLKGKHPFVAPNPELEAELIRMTRQQPPV